MRIVFIVFMSVMMLGCSPDYNWRTVALGAGEVTAFFPDKPQEQQRILDFSGQKITFSLTAAHVADAVFAVGYAALPDAVRNNPEARAELAAAVIRSLYQNLGQAAPEVLPALGKTFQVHGKAASGAVRLQATVWLTDTALVEGLVSAADKDFPDAQATEFFRGLSIPVK